MGMEGAGKPLEVSCAVELFRHDMLDGSLST